MLLSQFQYELPDEYIARFPVEPRDSSKLLVFKDKKIAHDYFYNLHQQLPKDCFLVFNDTKVIAARLFFQKKSGAIIEIFLLNPVQPTTIINDVMQQTQSCIWACMIGNKKRWKEEELEIEFVINDVSCKLKANWFDREKNEVKLTWKTEAAEPVTFAQVVESIGKIPLPPYLNRSAEVADNQSYQTVYSKIEGAVAAPTAGLHFTEQVFNNLAIGSISHDFVTLHVGAGTFQPVKVEQVLHHNMHTEQVIYRKSLIENLLQKPDCIVAVGTTSLRSLESLYWYGVQLLTNRQVQNLTNAHFFIDKLFPYQPVVSLPSSVEVLEAVLAKMQQENLVELVGETQIMIVPGYDFKLCKGLITNYHQPSSTLIMLIAAFVGEAWRNIYAEAIAQNYRFLSYGDSSLLWR